MELGSQSKHHLVMNASKSSQFKHDCIKSSQTIKDPNIKQSRIGFLKIVSVYIDKDARSGYLEVRREGGGGTLWGHVQRNAVEPVANGVIAKPMHNFGANT